MSKSDQDLQYVLGFDADMTKVDSALKDVGEKATKGGGIKGMLGGILGNLSGGGGLGASLGGIVGTAMGGPVGAAIGGVLGGGIDKIVAPAMALAGKAFGAITDPIGTLSSGLEELGGRLGPIGLILPPMLKNLVGTLTDFAAKASPGTALLFQHAVEDTQAVIGRTFVPVLGLMRDGVQLFGDVLASILPDTSEVSSALTEFKAAFSELRGSVMETVGEVGPILRTGILVSIRLLGDAAAWAVRQLQPLIRWVGDFFRPLRELLGLSAETRGSTGAAARPARFSGLEDYQRQLQLSAFSQAGGLTPEHRIAASTSQIQVIMEKIYNWLNDLSWSEIGRLVGVGIREAAMATGDAVNNAVDGGLESVGLGGLARRPGERGIDALSRFFFGGD